MDFLKKIYEKVEKKNTFISQQAYQYIWFTDSLKFSEFLFCICCKGLFCL